MYIIIVEASPYSFQGGFKTQFLVVTRRSAVVHRSLDLCAACLASQTFLFGEGPS
jgi:hypothetical protein